MSRPPYLLDLCWEPEDVLCLQNTASAPAQENDLHRGKHVFDAIHTPPPLYHHADVRRFVADASSSTDRASAGGRAPTEQHRMLAAIDEGRGAGRNLLFVAGATGAGKSHMVRWLHAQYSEQNPAVLSIHVRRRDTDLVKVVRRLASAFGRQGAALSKLVEDAEGAGAATTATLLNTTLVSALSAYAREVAEHSIRYSSSALTPQQAELRRAAGFVDRDPDPQPTNLDLVTEADQIKLTQDWAELVRTQPAEEALEEGLLTKMREADPEKRQVVGADLLPLSTLADEDLAPRLLPLRDRLADPSVRTWIADALLGPKAMDFAVQASGASIQAEQLQNALGDALEGAAEHGLRVVFFFEDWGSVTGVRSGLLEAFTSMDDTHTAVIADTTRELRKLQDNVADRSIAVFELGAVSDRFALQLAGRALNAVRVGGSQLHQASQAGAPLINRCTDCAFVGDCHRTFGAVEDDQLGPIGLFPLTPDVIERALARDGMEPTPRSMIMKILRKAIEHSHGAFQSFSYPTAEIAAALAPLERPLDDVDDLSEIRSVVGQQRATTAANVLHLYRKQRALRSLPPEVAEAFELTEFSIEATAAPPCERCLHAPCTCAPVEPARRQPPDTKQPPTASPPSIPDLAKDAEHFGRSEALRLGNKLRDLMFDYSTAGVGFGNGIATRSAFKSLRQLSEARFGLEGTQGQHVTSATRQDATSLRALAWAAQTEPPGSWREQDNGHRRRATALNQVATWTRAFDDELRSPKPRRQRASTLLPYLAALNALVRPRTPIDGPADLLNLALSEAGPERPETLQRNLKNGLDERPLARQHLLADLAFVQGDTGAVFGVDASLIYDDLRSQHAAGLQLPDVARLPEPLKRWGLAVSHAVEEARAELRQTLDSIEEQTDPVPDDQLEALRTAADAIRTASAQLPGRVVTAETMAINRLLASIDKARATPEPATFHAPDSIELLPPLELPGILQDAREFLARLSPRAEVTRAARAVVGMLSRTYESTYTQELSELDKLLHELENRAGNRWPATDGSSLQSAASGNRTESLVDQLVDVELSLRSEGQQIEFERRLRAAAARANKILDLLERQELLQQQRTALGVNPTRRRTPPAPPASDSVAHLLGGAITEWIETTERQLWEQGGELQVIWAQAKSDHQPTNHWQIARLLGDHVAEEAFEEADQLHENLGAEVPIDAQERLAAVRQAEQRAWTSLRSRRDGPALDLAIRIQENNGRLDLAEVDESDIVPLLGPDGDRKLRFELRILED